VNHEWLQRDEAELQRSPWQKQVSDWLTRSTISSMKPFSLNELRSSVKLNVMPRIVCSVALLSKLKWFRWFVRSSLKSEWRVLIDSLWMLDWCERFVAKFDWFESWIDWSEIFDAKLDSLETFEAKQDWFFGQELSTRFSNGLQPLMRLSRTAEAFSFWLVEKLKVEMESCPKQTSSRREQFCRPSSI